MSHSPRLAAARPPVLPTLSAFTEMPSACSRLDQYVEANAMAADHHKIGEMGLADQLHLDRRACSYAFRVLFDRDEPVCLAERGDRARTLAGRVGGQRSAVSAANE